MTSGRTYGPGKFEDAGGREIRLAQARRLFWQAVEDHAPEVFENLRESVLPLYQRDADGRGVPDTWSGPLDPNKAENQGDRALIEWAVRYRLQDDWCLDHALLRIRLWLSPPEETHEHDRRARVSWVELEVPDPTIQTFSVQYDPTVTTRKEFRKQVHKQLTAYMDSVEKDIENRGDVRRRRHQWEEYEKHFAWLVRSVIGGETFEGIAKGEEPRLTLQGVSQAVKRTAELIGLTIR